MLKKEDKWLETTSNLILFAFFIYSIVKSLKYLDIQSTNVFVLEILFYVIVFWLGKYYSNKIEIDLLEEFQLKLSQSNKEAFKEINFEYPKPKSEKKTEQLVWYFEKILEKTLPLVACSIGMSVTYIICYSLLFNYIEPNSNILMNNKTPYTVFVTTLTKVSLLFLLAYVPNLFFKHERMANKAAEIKLKYYEKYKEQAKD
jgi:hypothetical protein